MPTDTIKEGGAVMIKSNVWGILVTAVAFSVYAVALAAEHPSEHPSKKAVEHPGMKGKEKPELTKEALAQAISDYVKKDADIKEGYFLVYDEVEKKPVALTLEKVHDDKLSAIGNGVYFACADFKPPEGTLYELTYS